MQPMLETETSRNLSLIGPMAELNPPPPLGPDTHGDGPFACKAPSCWPVLPVQSSMLCTPGWPVFGVLCRPNGPISTHWDPGEREG